MTEKEVRRKQEDRRLSMWGMILCTFAFIVLIFPFTPIGETLGIQYRPFWAVNFCIIIPVQIIYTIAVIRNLIKNICEDIKKS